MYLCFSIIQMNPQVLIKDVVVETADGNLLAICYTCKNQKYTRNSLLIFRSLFLSYITYYGFENSISLPSEYEFLRRQLFTNRYIRTSIQQ